MASLKEAGVLIRTGPLLKRRLRIEAAKESTTMTDIASRVLLDWLNQRDAEEIVGNPGQLR
ncbi:hypothetical protein [Cyanobium sp. N5-Cardenillas]|uniref:hypothetical protein n=1 Tax=Cyanobium sp. N5-Cardenillas TaxID=2823720 RepID=UPI0020CCADB4|nr:hypothetical protein [Cyanobium sp. N5-Cardenillas]MCP9786014.1 hypothetical protein [Cyanobium sp. N5-Cardenillas]